MVKKFRKEEELTKKLYTQEVKGEWKRVVKDEFHLLEFGTTLHFLKKYLLKKALILDAGGGPGRYTIKLAKLGYDVVLLDLVPAHLEFAKKRIKKAKVENKVKGVIEGSIVNLSMFKDNFFDAVVCLGGPLSHVAPESNRRKAVSELIRVAKKNAPIFISVMGKYGTIMNCLARWPNEVKMTSHFERFYIHGDDYLWRGGRGYCHFFTLNEFEKLLGNKVKVLERVGLEGLATTSEEAVNKHFKDTLTKRNWLKMHYRLCTKPSVADSSLHMMVVCKKRGR